MERPYDSYFKFLNNSLIENVEGEILAHVEERIGGGACAGSVHQIHQRALLRRKRHALVPHLRVSEMFHYILIKKETIHPLIYIRL